MGCMWLGPMTRTKAGRLLAITVRPKGFDNRAWPQQTRLFAPFEPLWRAAAVSAMFTKWCSFALVCVVECWVDSNILVCGGRCLTPTAMGRGRGKRYYCIFFLKISVAIPKPKAHKNKTYCQYYNAAQAGSVLFAAA